MLQKLVVDPCHREAAVAEHVVEASAPWGPASDFRRKSVGCPGEPFDDVAEMANEVDPNSAMAPARAAMLLLDIERAYPNVPHDVAEGVFRRMGVLARMRAMLRGLPQLSWYKVRTAEGISRSFKMEKGVREGDPVSRVAFNYVHCNTMEGVRKRAQAQLGDRYGLLLGEDATVPLGSRNRLRTEAPGQRRLRIHHEEGFRLFDVLFADDTTIFTREQDARETEQLVISKLARWGATAHPGKLERIVAPRPHLQEPPLRWRLRHMRPPTPPQCGTPRCVSWAGGWRAWAGSTSTRKSGWRRHRRSGTNLRSS